MRLPRALSPATNMPGLTAAALAAYAVVQAILNARAAHHAPWGIDPRVVVAAVTAFASLYARTQVTPVADPRVPGKVIADVTAAPDAVIRTGVKVSQAELDAIGRVLDGAAVLPSGVNAPGAAVQPPATSSGPVSEGFQAP